MRRITRIETLVVLLLVTTSWAGCVNAKLDWGSVGGGSGNGNGSNGDGTLTLSPSTKTLASTRTLSLATSGGLPPYQFELTSETAGTLSAIDSTAGTAQFIPTASTSEAVASVIVTDSAGETGTSVITVPASGSLDTTFNGNGFVVDSAGKGASEVNALALQSDGKIVVAGYLLNVVDTEDFMVVRYDSDGTRDDSFGTAGVATADIGLESMGVTVSDRANAVGIQSTGQIVAAGVLGSGVASNFAVARFTAAGALDTGFTPKTSALDFEANEDIANSLSILSDDRLLIGGSATFSEGGVTRGFGVLRLNANGVREKTYQKAVGDGISVSSGFGAAMTTDNMVVAGGWMEASGSSDNNFVAVRWNSETQANLNFSSFDFGPSAVDDFANALLLLPDNTFILGGQTGAANIDESNEDLGLMKFQGAGLDVSFNSNGKLQLAFGIGGERVMALASDVGGKIWVAGSSGARSKFLLTRLTEAGNVDPTFAGGVVLTPAFTTAANYARAMAIDAEGRVVLAGLFMAASVQKFIIVRYWP